MLWFFMKDKMIKNFGTIKLHRYFFSTLCSQPRFNNIMLLLLVFFLKKYKKPWVYKESFEKQQLDVEL